MISNISNYKAEKYLKPGQVFAVYRSSTNQPSEIWHDHDFFEVAVVIEGRGSHKTLEKKTTYRKGSLHFISIGKPHAYTVLAPTTTINFIITKNFLKKISIPQILQPIFEKSGRHTSSSDQAGSTLSVQIPAEHFISIRAVAEDLLYEHRAMRDDYLNVQVCDFQKFLLLVKRVLLGQTDAAPSADKKDQYISAAADFMNRNHARTMSLADIAGAANLSRIYFTALFKKKTGYSPFEYLNEVRIIKACDLLKTTDKKVTAICYEVGYNNSSFFYEVFTRQTGMKPLQYRTVSRK